MQTSQTRDAPRTDSAVTLVYDRPAEVPPRVSMILCTKDRASQLRTCLGYIGRMQVPFSWELLLVDNGSTDDTAAVIGDFVRDFPHPVRHLHVSTPGNGAGRNAAIELSSGDVLAFTDDDCYVDLHYLREIDHAFRDARIGYLSGRIMLFDRDDYPITINESLEDIPVPAGTFFRGGLIHGANMAFRRKALRDAGLFDGLFGAGARFAGEDWELALRVSAAGWAGGYFPGPVVWHHHGRRGSDVPRLMRFYALGEGAVYAKMLLHPRMRWKALRHWIKLTGGDVLKRRAFGHILTVATGALQYWKVRRQQHQHT